MVLFNWHKKTLTNFKLSNCLDILFKRIYFGHYSISFLLMKLIMY